MGQWTSMTVNERLKLFTAWVQANRASSTKLNLLAHVGALDLESACELSRKVTTAHRHDLAGLSIIAPSFVGRPGSPEMIAQWIKAVYNCQAGNPYVPMYYYHFPAMTGINFPMQNIAAALKKIGISLGGVKFVSDDVLDFVNTSVICGKF